MVLKVIDRFTTRDGRWEVDDRPYGVTKEIFEKYGSVDIPGKGGASHIFVKVLPRSAVVFYTSDFKNRETKIADDSGWVNFNLWKSSAFWPPNEGPWMVDVGNVNVARGLGLPEGLHVSTFLIVGDVDEGSHPSPPSEKPVSHIQVIAQTMVDNVIVDSVLVFDNWRAK